MFAKSDYVERWLDSVQAEYKYRGDIPIAKLNPGWSDQNPARPGKAIIDVALVYAERMEGGELAPPAIIVKSPSGYIILDGRQRIFAAQTAGASVFAAYELIDPSARLEHLVALGANQALNGIRPSIDFVVEEALKFMDSYGATAREAARLAGVTKQTIERHLSAKRVRDALLAKKVEPSLVNGSLAALEPLMKEPAALMKAYYAIERSRANVDMAEALVREMLKNPGKGRFIALDRWLERSEIRGRIAANTKRKNTVGFVLFTRLRGARTLLQKGFDELDKELKEPERRELAKLAGYIAARVKQLCGDVIAPAR